MIDVIITLITECNLNLSAHHGLRAIFLLLATEATRTRIPMLGPTFWVHCTRPGVCFFCMYPTELYERPSQLSDVGDAAICLVEAVCLLFFAELPCYRALLTQHYGVNFGTLAPLINQAHLLGTGDQWLAWKERSSGPAVYRQATNHRALGGT